MNLPPEFGRILRQARRRAGMTQSDLAAATGYSISYISSLECAVRAPNVDEIVQRFVPALGLQEDPRLANALVEAAAQTRGLAPSAVRVGSQRVPTVRSQAQAAAMSGSLPMPPTTLIGREAELKLLCNRLLGHQGRLLTLLGPPGVGKTRLALEMGHRLAPMYRDGAAFVPLMALRRASELAPAISTALGGPTSSKKSPTAHLIGLLRRRELLLVLDNLEHLLDGDGEDREPAVTLIASLLAECPGLQLVVTSRERLRLRAEQRHRVAPLPLDAAVELLAQRAQLLDTDANPAEFDQAILRAICQQLDCLPLAIELAAARLDLVSPAALLVDVQQRRLDVLVGGAADLPPAQRTLRGAIESSYRLLSAHERVLFRMLGLFVGSFDLDAVAAILAADEPGARPAIASTLEVLVGKSLVVAMAEAGETRFILLETLREFALEQLAQSGQETILRRHHAHYFGALAAAAARSAQAADAATWLAALEQAHGNLRATLTWCTAHEPTAALALAVDLEEFWFLRGYGGEAEQWLRDALRLNPQPSRLRARGLLALASVRRRAGDMEAASHSLQEAETLVASLDDVGLQLDLHHVAGWYAYDAHQYAPTVDHFTRGLALARAQDEPAQVIRFLTGLIHVQRDRPDLRDQVAAYLDECLSLLRGVDDPKSLAFTLQQCGALEAAAGRYDAARPYYEKMLAIYHRTGNKLGLAWGLELMAEVAWYQADLETARRQHEQALALFSELDNRDGLTIVLYHLGQVAQRLDALATATSYYLRSLDHAYGLRNRHMMARGLAGLGDVALQEGREEDAAYLLSGAHEALAALPPFLAPPDQAAFVHSVAQIAPRRQRPAVDAAWARGKAATTEQIVLMALQRWGD